jgi:hypothetical protein
MIVLMLGDGYPLETFWKLKAATHGESRRSADAQKGLICS